MATQYPTRYLLKMILMLFAGVPIGQGAVVAQEKPNIVFLLADDLGYGDLSSYGSQSMHTPNIDHLAANGLKFTRFYAGSAVCSPSRASMLTGRFPLRFSIEKHFKDDDVHLPREAITIPALLKEVGYYTAHIGKWHLGGVRGSDIEKRQKGEKTIAGPADHGFDYYLVSREDSVRSRLLRSRRLYRDGGSHLIENDAWKEPIKEHWTTIKIDAAIDQIRYARSIGNPFYINLWFDVPHTPYEPAPEPHYHQYIELGAAGDQACFRSMVSHLDAEIGRLVRYLDDEKILEKTLIVFTLDNGPAYQGSPGPFKGGKTDLHEGGIRVPMIMVWKDQIQPQDYSFQMAHMVDFLPTFCQLAGVKPPFTNLLDGASLVPLMMGNKTIERNHLCWQMGLYKHYQNQGPKPEPYITTVITQGKWKLTGDGKEALELFDLENDHRELSNLQQDRPEKRNELQKLLNAFIDAPRIPVAEEID